MCPPNILQIQCWAKNRKRIGICHEDGTRGFATEKPSASQVREELAKEHVKNLSNKQKAKKEARAVDKGRPQHLAYADN